MNKSSRYSFFRQNNFSEIESRYFTQSLSQKPALKMIYKKIQFRKNILALDLGCGTGLLEESLGKNNNTVVGVDLNRRYLEIAKRCFVENGTFIMADARFLPFKREIFDIIVVHDVCYVLNISKIIFELNRFLKDGQVYFDIPNINFYRTFPFLLPFPRFVSYNLKMIENSLNKNGLKILRKYVVSFSEETRRKLKIPLELNLCMNILFERLPDKCHNFFANFWYLVILVCEKNNSPIYSKK